MENSKKTKVQLINICFPIKFSLCIFITQTNLFATAIFKKKKPIFIMSGSFIRFSAALAEREMAQNVTLNNDLEACVKPIHGGC